MSSPEALAPAAKPPVTQVHADAADDRVLAQQLTLLCRHWLRVPVPVFAVCAVVVYLAWDYKGHALLLGWAALTVAAVIARMQLCRGVLKAERAVQNPARLARALTGMAALNGLLSGAAGPLLLPGMPPAEQALITMVLGCWGAGAVAANGSFPRAYYGFAWPFFLQLGFAWVLSGDDAAVWVIGLLALFVVVLSAFVRDNGRMVLEAIQLRYANEELLAKAEAARRKAEQASRSKTDFLASASHDLRQPVHALKLLTALLSERASASERDRELGLHIVEAVDSLDRLFAALLDLSRLDAGALTTEPRRIDLAELVRPMVIEYRATAHAKGLEFEAQTESLWVHADPILVERIVRNLLENAIRFTERGRVRIGCRRAGRDILVAVQDTGCGIPEAEQSRVFEEFYQLGNRNRDRSKGLGLGLSIVKRLSDLMGYRIALESQPGRGSTFTLTMCDALLEDPLGEPHAAKPRPAADVSGLRVLVIEDDAQARQAMLVTLRHWGCDAVLAGSLAEAQAALRGRPRVDVVLSDLRLDNHADGIAAVDALRAEFGPLPAALITGDVAVERRADIRSASVPLLQKPVDPAVLRMLLYQLARGTPEP